MKGDGAEMGADRTPKQTGVAGMLVERLGRAERRNESGVKEPKTGWSHLVRRLACDSVSMRQIKVWIRNKVRQGVGVGGMKRNDLARICY